MNLNEYFSNGKDLKNKILVISGKDEPSKWLSNFVHKENINLQMDIGFRNSYIAVVDYNRGFIFENSQSGKYECSYQVKNKFIDIVSAGFEGGNVSSIKIDDKEYSDNRRGLNFALFNYKTLALIDKFHVDTYGDKTLEIRR